MAYGRVEGNECRCGQTPGAVAGAGWAGRAALPLGARGTRPGQAARLGNQDTPAGVRP